MKKTTNQPADFKSTLKKGDVIKFQKTKTKVEHRLSKEFSITKTFKIDILIRLEGDTLICEDGQYQIKEIDKVIGHQTQLF